VSLINWNNAAEVECVPLNSVPATIRVVARVGVVVLAALAVAEIAAAVFVIRDDHSPAPAVAAPASTPAVTTSSPPPSLGVDATSTSRAPASSVLIAFLGDDWTAGTGASRAANRFTTLVAHQLGVAERSFGVAGTGYAKPSAAGGPYFARVAAVVAAHPDVVVVSGGRNDASDSPATAADDARQLFATLHTKLPDAVLIGVAPFWGDSDLPPEMIQLGHAVKAAVTAAGGTYLDLPDPIHGHPSFMADAADPNDQGYAAIAAALAPALQPLLPTA
jgi:lysophospholipase L1-like esterase